MIAKYKTTPISAADPFIIPDGQNLFAVNSCRYPNGKTIRSPRLNAGEGTGVFVLVGASNIANSVNAAYTPTNASKVDNFNVFDGGTYAAVDPLLGATYSNATFIGHTFGRVADKLINAGKYARVILAPTAFGGTYITDWRAGGRHNRGPLLAAQRLASVGLPVTAFILCLGENDNTLGILQAEFTAGLNEVIGTPRAAGYNAPWLIGKCTYTINTTSSAVRAAVDAVVNGTTIFVGADTDTLTGTAVNRQADDTHFTAAGSDAAADLWKAAIIAAL